MKEFSKQEAIDLMKQGKKVTHRTFCDDEWMTIVGNKIVFEDGVMCSFEEFWEDRTDWIFDTYYSLFERNDKW